MTDQQQTERPISKGRARSNLNRLNSILFHMEKLQADCRDEILADRIQTAKNELLRDLPRVEAAANV